MAHAVLDVDDLERPWMTLPVCDDADTSQVMATGCHAHVSFKQNDTSKDSQGVA